MRRRYSAEQWGEWIDQQGESGQTIAAFCLSIGVTENSFYVWRRKLRSGAGLASRSEEPQAADFVPLSVVNSSGASSRVEIELPCGAVVRVPADALLIRQMMEVLLEFGTSNVRLPAADPGGSSC